MNEDELEVCGRHGGMGRYGEDVGKEGNQLLSMDNQSCSPLRQCTLS